MGDAGLTGRKIIVDTYGGMARHGGGAFSGKDPSKVDRSAAYAMRWVAKNVVAAGLARRCEAQVAYAIGKAQPVGVFVETFGTGTVPDEKIQEAVLQVFDLRPAAIIADLDLLRPIYAKTAAYGHFGRELPEFTWERTDRVDALRPLSASERCSRPSAKRRWRLVDTAPMTDEAQEPAARPARRPSGTRRPRRRRPGSARAAEAATAEVDPVARVLVDLPLAHLDRPFDYGVPADDGRRGRARVRGSRCGSPARTSTASSSSVPPTSEHPGRLTPLRRVGQHRAGARPRDRRR